MGEVRVAIVSDTHGHLDTRVAEEVAACDNEWSLEELRFDPVITR